MNLLEFYEEKRGEFKDLELINSLLEKKPSIRQQLENAKKYRTLKKLCGSQDEIMFVVLQIFLILPSFKRTDSFSKSENIKLKNEPAKVKRYIKKLAHDCVDAIGRVKSIDPAIDEKEFMNVAEKWMNHKGNMKILGLDKLDDAIELVCMIDKRIDANRLRKKLSTSLPIDHEERKNLILKRLGINDSAKDSGESLFNSQLLLAYKICKEKTDNSDNAVYERMAAVLNSLKITTKTGKPFTRKGLASILKNPA